MGPQGLKGDKGDKGDTGAAGKDGVSGYTRVVQSASFNVNGSTVDVACAPGSVVLGGGVSGNVVLEQSYPSASDTWTVVAHKANGQNQVGGDRVRGLRDGEEQLICTT